MCPQEFRFKSGKKMKNPAFNWELEEEYYLKYIILNYKETKLKNFRSYLKRKLEVSRTQFDEWFIGQRREIKQRALQLLKMYQKTDLKLSKGWIDKFRDWLYGMVSSEKLSLI